MGEREHGNHIPARLGSRDGRDQWRTGRQRARRSQHMELFDRRCNPNVKPPKNKRLNSEQKYSHRGTKVLTADDHKYSPPLASDDRKYSEGGQDDREQKYSDLDLPSPIGEAVLPVSTSDDATALRPAADDWRRNSKTEAKRLNSPDDDLSIPEFLRRTVK